MSDAPRAHAPAALRSVRDARGRFIHPWPLGEDAGRGFRELMKWRRERMRTGIPPDPPRSAFRIASPRVAVPRSAANELRITWVGHATFLIQLAGVNILTDPVWSERASPLQWAGPKRLVSAALPFDDLPPIDVVILSHDHYDHLDAPTVRRLRRRFGDSLRWVAPLGYARLLRRFGVTALVELDWWEETSIPTAAGPLHLRATPAQHWSKRSPFDDRVRLWSSWVLGAGTARVYFGGDSGYYDGFRAIGQLGPFHAVLLPIGAYDPRWFMKPAHMNPEEAVRAFTELGATGVFIGMHWGTFRLADEPPLEPPMRTAAAWRERALPPEQLWIPRHGETHIIPLR